MSSISTEPSSFVSRHRLGDVELASIDVGTMHFRLGDNPALRECSPWSWDDLTEPDGRVVMGSNVVVARTATATVVIDPCTFDPGALTLNELVFVPGAHLDAGLEVLGVAPDDVTHVVVTHTHEDHFSGILGDDRPLRFPRALHVIPAADWESIVLKGHPFAASAEELQRRLPISGKPGGALLVQGVYRVCDGISTIATAGETEGHQIVRIQTPAGRAYVLGDLVHWAVELEDPRLMGPVSSPPELRRRVIEETQEEPSVLIFTHARFPGWGTLTPTGSEMWAWRDLGSG